MADDDDKNREAIEVMRGQARAYDLKVDPLWSPEELAQKIIDAQVALDAKASEEFQKAKKVKVRARRDCWALTTRIPAGKTVDVPIELARRWLEDGAAERADPLPEI
jgi:hypothetical protein